MKKKSKLNWGALLEGLCELVIMLVFLAIGTVIVGVFAGESTAENTDHDTLVFIGMVAFIIAFGSLTLAIFGIVRFFIKKTKKLRKQQNDKEKFDSNQ